jgi:hypothetical protein
LRPNVENPSATRVYVQSSDTTYDSLSFPLGGVWSPAT